MRWNQYSRPAPDGGGVVLCLMFTYFHRSLVPGGDQVVHTVARLDAYAHASPSHDSFYGVRSHGSRA